MASHESHEKSDNNVSPHGIQGKNKPCRACTDFHTWTANLKQNPKVKEQVNVQVNLQCFC